MILHTAGEEVTVEQLAAEMVDIAKRRRESVCAVFKGIPLVTYSNDTRTRAEKIENLTLAFLDSFLRSQMSNYPVPENDPRFDPKFRCENCEISASREKVLREMLEALTSLARQKMPKDEEIVAMAKAATTVLMGTALQKEMVESIGKMLKP